MTLAIHMSAVHWRKLARLETVLATLNNSCREYLDNPFVGFPTAVAPSPKPVDFAVHATTAKPQTPV